MYRKDFITNGKKAIVDTENNEKKEFVYYDGLAEKLSQENLVEDIRNKITYYLDCNDLEDKRHSCIRNLMLIMVMCSISFLALTMLDFIFGGIYLVLSIILANGTIYDLIKTNKQIKRNHKVIIPYLQDKLDEAIEKLAKLKTKEGEQLNQVEDITIKNIPDNEEIDKINFDIKVTNNIENKRKKYLLYFELGLLRKKLKSKGYSEEEIEQIEKEISNEATHKEENNSYRLKMSIRRNIYNCLKK